MTLRYLQIFAKVCEHMSMSEAAKELYVSQSAVSQAIRELESYYELSLFMRDRRKLRLTHAGEMLLSYAQRMLLLNDGIDRAMRETKLAPEIRLGVTDGLSEYYLPALLKHYLAEDGSSRIVLYSASRARIEEALINNELDLAIFEGPVRPRTFQTYHLFSNRIEVFCAQDSRISPRLSGETPGLTISELAALPLLLTDRKSAAHSMVAETLRANGTPLELPGMFSSAASLCSAVRNDLGVGILPQTAIQGCTGIKHIQVENWNCFQHVYLIHHQKRFIFKQLKHFIDYILAEAKHPLQTAPENET